MESSRDPLKRIEYRKTGNSSAFTTTRDSLLVNFFHQRKLTGSIESVAGCGRGRSRAEQIDCCEKPEPTLFDKKCSSLYRVEKRSVEPVGAMVGPMVCLGRIRENHERITGESLQDYGK